MPFPFLSKGRTVIRPEEQLRRLLLQALEVLRETEEIVDELPPELGRTARSSFDQSVGETIGDLRRRLEKTERRLLHSDLSDIPRPELLALRERVARLYEHMVRSYRGAMKLTGDRRARKAIRASARRRADKVKELLAFLDRTVR